MEYRIVDDAGAESRAATAGELLVRQKGDDPRRGFFTEYLKDEAATAEAWAGGWFHTGDVVCEGEDRSLFFVDRKKNIVRRSGENIAVIEVEGVLMNLDGSRECRGRAGAGRDPRRGSVRADRAARTASVMRARLAEAIARACAERLAYYKVPAHIAFVDAIPVTATQKLQRGAIKALAAAGGRRARHDRPARTSRRGCASARRRSDRARATTAS